MKALVFNCPGSMSLEERRKPPVGAYDALVKVNACGICGTDIHVFRGEHLVEFPVVPGHEFSGVVVEAGNEVTNVCIGDRVTVDPNVIDGICFFCRRGNIQLCENLTAIGLNYDGGFAEYCRVPAHQLYSVPDDVSLDEAALAEPLACCIHGIDRAPITAGDTVLVLGAGTIGLMMVQLARIAGAEKVIVSEPESKKRSLALQLGACAAIDPVSQDMDDAVMELTGIGPGIVIECAGRVETVEIAVKLARRGGTILQFGVTSPDWQARISPYDIFSKELTIMGSFINPFTHSRAVELLASGMIDVKPLITHIFPLEDAMEGFKSAKESSAIKVLVKP